MLLDLNQIDPEGLRFEHRLDLSGLRDEEDHPIVVGPALLRGEAFPGDRSIELRAHLEAPVRLECSRCLEPYDWRAVTDFHLQLVAEAVEFGPGETRMDPADASLFYTSGGKADLVAMAAEQVYLLLPLKPICRADCAGLCPTCGANRNRIECDCRPVEIDPRLAPLLKLKNT